MSYISFYIEMGKIIPELMPILYFDPLEIIDSVPELSLKVTLSGAL